METAAAGSRTTAALASVLRSLLQLSVNAVVCAVPLKNKSEMLLEGYLRHQGYNDFDFEPEMAGTTRRPDYRLRWASGDVLLEVKAFRANADDFRTGFGFFDPYRPLREKIDTARDKFSKLKQYCCCLVLYNVDKPLILLDRQHIYGAMLGNLGWSVPLDLPGRPAPEEAEIRSIFMGGGKMHRERSGTPKNPQNQTISGIIVLGRVAAGERLFAADIRAVEQREQRSIGLEERLQRLELANGTASDFRHRPVRVVVHENPYARIPVPADLFRGAWDERFGSRDGRIQRLFQGESVARLPPQDS
jgi:hypothetical protein